MTARWRLLGEEPPPVDAYGYWVYPEPVWRAGDPTPVEEPMWPLAWKLYKSWFRKVRWEIQGKRYGRFKDELPPGVS